MEATANPHVNVNGRPHPLGDVGGHVTLLSWLRECGFTGVKEGCAEGECGACAVLVARPHGDDATCWTAINACLVPAAGMDGQEVVTAEGLGRPEAMHPVQQRMADLGGSQCGFCTPGFVCSMASEYYRPDRTPTASGTRERAPEAEPGVAGERELLQEPSSNGGPTAPSHAPDHEHGPNGFDLHALSGNLCRCTGYRPIRDAAYGLGQPGADDPLLARCSAPAPGPAATRITNPQGSFLRPASLDEALQMLAEHPQAQLVAGSTDWGVELNIRHARAEVSIGIDRLPELRELSIGAKSIELGAALSLTEIERGLAGRVPLLARLFPQFGSRLIRNGATLGGNLGTGSPIGDAMPALLALDARLVLTSRSEEREVALSDYYTGYRRSVRRPDELIKAVRIPTPLAPVTAFHKIAKRRFDDISSVAIAFAATLDRTERSQGYAVVRDIRIGLGGVAATPMRAQDTEAALTGRPWSPDTVAEAAEVLGAEGTPLSDHRASGDYRTAMLRSALLKFHAESAPPAYQEV
ncbi:MAG: xanthine dehydrogenase small subunit [Ornithinimicrobium sp.]|uniref:xanthine dehydrogenase small subunit n=1 Tax=Ornithinimicrobium sp. TaxID=1977084 RepID=UPI003D9ACF03